MMNVQHPFVRQVSAIVERKPMIFLYISLAYLILVALLKWFIYLPIASLLYLAGGIIGVYFLDAAEEFFKLSPSPFRSIIFQGLLVIVSLFVITSSGSFLASGLVLTLSLTLLLRQWGNWRIMTVFILLFLLETWLFIR